MRQPLFESDKTHYVIPKVQKKAWIFVWSSHTWVKDGEPIIQYHVHDENGIDVTLTEEELLEKYHFIRTEV